jgi:hypothetical protein
VGIVVGAMIDTLQTWWFYVAAAAMVAWVERAGVVAGENKQTEKGHVAWWVGVAAAAAAGVVFARTGLASAVPHALLAVSAWTSTSARNRDAAVVSDAWMRCAWGAVLSLALSPVAVALSFCVVALSLARGRRQRNSEEAALKLWMALYVASTMAIVAFVVVGSVAQPLWMLLFLMVTLGAFPLHGLLSDANTAMPDPVLYPTLVWVSLSTISVAWPFAAPVLLVSACVLLWMAFHENSIGRLFALSAMAMACIHYTNPTIAAATSAVLLLTGGRELSGLTWESMSGAGRARPLRHGLIVVAVAVAMGVPATPLFFVRLAEAAHDGMRSVVACGVASVLSGLCVLRLCVFLFSKSPRSS